MFGRSGDIFEEEKPEEEKLTRAQRKEERLQEKEKKRQEKEDLRQQKAAFEEEMKNRELERKRQKQIEKEDEKNAKLALKATKKIEKAERRLEKKEKHSVKNIVLLVLLCIICFASGFGAALLVTWLNGVSFDIFAILPFVVLVDVFAFSTASFFQSDGKREIISGACSLLSLAGGIAELAWLFH